MPAFSLRGLLLVASASCWIGGIFLASLLTLPSLLYLLAACLSLLLLLPFWHNKQIRLLSLLACCLCIGAWRYTTNLPANDPQAISHFISSTTIHIRGTVNDVPKVAGHSRVLLISTDSVSNTSAATSWQPVHGTIEVIVPGTEIDDIYGANYGDNVELQGKLTTASPYSPTGVFASMAFPRITVTAFVGNPIIAAIYHMRTTFALAIARTLPEPQAALLIAIILGLRTPQLAPLQFAFNVTGTAHLIVPSGFKVTILAGLTRAIIAPLVRSTDWQQLPAERQRNWHQWLSTCLTSSIIIIYTILSGASASAIRAGIMGILLIVAPRLGRTYNVYTALAASALIMSIINPFILWDAGFQLSFLGTLSIVLYTPTLQRWLQRLLPLPAKTYLLHEMIAVTLAAQLGTFPISMVTFQQLSWIAPLANILTVPLLESLLLIGCFICGAGMLFPWLAGISGWIAWPLLWYIGNCIQWCASLPGAYLLVPDTMNYALILSWLYYACLGAGSFYLLRKRPNIDAQQIKARRQHLTSSRWRILQCSYAVCMVLMTFIASGLPQQTGDFRLSFLPVASPGQTQQGEAIFIRTPDNHTLLIDGGPDATSLATTLDQRLPYWQRSLDMVILTSPQTDHITGLQDIVTRYAIKQIIDAGMQHPSTTYARWRRTISERNLPYTAVSQGQTIPLGTQVSLQVWWPPYLTKSSRDVRDHGLVLRLIAPGIRILFLGVTAQSASVLKQIQQTVPASMLSAEIIQMVAQKNKTMPAELIPILQEAQPSYIVVSPAALAKQQATNPISQIPPLPVKASIIYTDQVNTLAFSSNQTGWWKNQR